MPQLDTTTFPSQLFWLCVSFAALYFIIAYIALPKITRVLEVRDETLKDKINRASLYREEAESLLTDYEATLNEARQTAQLHYKAIANATISEVANRQKDLFDKLNARLHLAEQDLYKARLEAGSEIKSMVGEIANAILYKLTGRTYSSKEFLENKEEL